MGAEETPRCHSKAVITSRQPGDGSRVPTELTFSRQPRRSILVPIARLQQLQESVFQSSNQRAWATTGSRIVLKCIKRSTMLFLKVNREPNRECPVHWNTARAGQAKRLHPFRYPKELLPIAFATEDCGTRARPIPVAEYSLRAFGRAEVRKTLLIVADWKTEIVRYFGDVADLGMRIAYLSQTEPRGLADAVDLCFEWVQGDNACLALPDTIFRPIDAVAIICKELLSRRSDLVLGVFPTKRPQHLGPVRMTADGRVSEVQDKPAQTDLMNTWGVAAWSAAFGQLLHDALSTVKNESHPPIGHFFNLAARQGLEVHAVYFADGHYIDVGMADGIGSLVLNKEL